MKYEPVKIKISEVIGDIVIRMLLFEEELHDCAERWGFEIESNEEAGMAE